MFRIWMRRQSAFLDFCLAALLRRKIKNGALLTGYTLIVFMLTSVLFFADALRHEATIVLQKSPELVVQRMITGRYTPIPLTYRTIIQKLRGVQKVTPRYWGYYFHPVAEANYTVMATQTPNMQVGRARIGAGVARTWQVEVGAPIFFKSSNGRIIGLNVEKILPGDTELVSADLIRIHLSDFQTIFGLTPEMATDLAVTVRNPKEVRILAEKIAHQLPDTRLVQRDDMIRSYSALFDWRSGYTLVMLIGTIGAFFILALDKATALSAEESKEIAILKAIGWDTADVLLLKFYEGLIISLTAFIAGVIAAYLHVFLAQGVLFEHAIKGWSVLYPDMKLIPVVDIYQLAVILGLTVGPYALLTIVPAWRAATIDPAMAIRRMSS